MGRRVRDFRFVVERKRRGWRQTNRQQRALIAWLAGPILIASRAERLSVAAELRPLYEQEIAETEQQIIELGAKLKELYAAIAPKYAAIED